MHAISGEEGMWFGVDVMNNQVADMFKEFVWEPDVVRINVITAACEAACTILSVDQTIKNPKSEQQQSEVDKRLQGQRPGPMRPNMGRGIRGRGGR